MPKSHRSALAKFRCGVAPIRLETGRYEGLPEGERTCFNCNDVVESESHVLIECSLYDDLRRELLMRARNLVNSFDSLHVIDKLIVILDNNILSKITAKTCSEILKRRRDCLYT